MSTAPVLRRPPTERELAAHNIAQRLDRPVGVLGVVALVLWLLEPLAHSRGWAIVAVDALWALIAVAFVVEFVARAVVAPETGPFLRHHWWELGLIALPFLRFMRVLRAGRAGRGIASAVRSGQRAGAKLRSRLTLLLVVTVVVACAGGRLLWEFGGYERSYADALHDSAMSTVTGAALGVSGAFAQVLEVVLAVYSGRQHRHDRRRTRCLLPRIESDAEVAGRAVVGSRRLAALGYRRPAAGPMAVARLLENVSPMARITCAASPPLVTTTVTKARVTIAEKILRILSPFMRTAFQG